MGFNNMDEQSKHMTSQASPGLSERKTHRKPNALSISHQTVGHPSGILFSAPVPATQVPDCQRDIAMRSAPFRRDSVMPTDGPYLAVSMIVDGNLILSDRESEGRDGVNPAVGINQSDHLRRISLPTPILMPTGSRTSSTELRAMTMGWEAASQVR
jgi:hypothetical protein